MRKTWDSFDKLNGKVVKSIDYIGTNHKMEDHEFVSGKVIVLVFEDGSKLRVDCATNNENGIIFFANVPHQPASPPSGENKPSATDGRSLAGCDGSRFILSDPRFINLLQKSPFLSRSQLSPSIESWIEKTYSHDQLEQFGKDAVALAMNMALKELRLIKQQSLHMEAAKKTNVSADLKSNTCILAYLRELPCRLRYSWRAFRGAWLYGWKTERKFI